MATPSTNRPALLGGPTAFPDGLRFARPSTPPLDVVVERLRPSYDEGQLTNGHLVRLLEEQAAERLGAQTAVAVSSCTAGLMLVLQALRVDGCVLVPSFTFSASAHAIAWNGLVPRFAECDSQSFQLDPDDAWKRLDGVGAVMATHVFGAPCGGDAIEDLAASRGIPVVFDAAHGFGALHGERPVGSFGTAEVFSLSPTKVVVAGEGGIVTTGDEELAAQLRLGRDYGNPGDYDTRFAGLNARMSELHAAVALESLAELDEHLEARRALADHYCSLLAGVPGVRPQEVPAEDRSTYKDFTVAIDEDAFGLDRDQLAAGLRAEGIDTRCYFFPPVHRQQAYADLDPSELPVTDAVAASVLSLPLYPSLAPTSVERVTDRILALHHHAGEVSAADR